MQDSGLVCSFERLWASISNTLGESANTFAKVMPRNSCAKDTAGLLAGSLLGEVSGSQHQPTKEAPGSLRLQGLIWFKVVGAKRHIT